MKLNTILVGDVLEKLKEIPDDSIDCIVTSPPYLGLRDYGQETEVIWGGDKNCIHEWEVAGGGLLHENRNNLRGTQEEVVGQRGYTNIFKYNQRGSGVCSKCGAWRGQLGLEPSLEMYLEHMLSVTKELHRVLKPTGTLFWNHGDSYNSHSIGEGGVGGIEGKRKLNDEEYAKAIKAMGTRFDKRNYGGLGEKRQNTMVQGCSRGNPVPDKCLLLQNFRLAQRIVDEQHWILRNVIIWHKLNCMPSSVKDRFTVDFEPVFFFVKSKKYYFETQYELYTAPLDRWGGDTLKASGESTWDKGTGQTTYRNRNMRPNALGRNKRAVWTIPTKPFPEAHFATFPEKLIEPMISAGCPEFICKKCGKAREKIFKVDYIKNRPSAGNDLRAKNKDRLAHARGHGGWRGNNLLAQRKSVGYSDCGCNAGWDSGVVLDPFLGSGTTAVVANKLRRDWIGIELNPAYAEIAKKRIAENPKPMI